MNEYTVRKVGRLQILHKRTTSTTPFLVCAYLLGFLIAFRINIAYSTKFSFYKRISFLSHPVQPSKSLQVEHYNTVRWTNYFVPHVMLNFVWLCHVH